MVYCAVGYHDTRLCPAGTIPYDSYYCSGVATNEYNCTEIQPGICPSISGLTLSQKFISSTFVSSATVECEYRFSGPDVTKKTLNDWSSKIGVDNDYNTLVKVFCSKASNVGESECLSYCSANKCQSVYNYCGISSNVASPTCQTYLMDHTHKYPLSDFYNSIMGYCQGSNLDSSFCKYACFKANNAINCDSNVKEYCSDPSVTSDICPCFRTSDYYKDEIIKHFSNISNIEERDTLIQLFSAVPGYCSAFTNCSSPYLPHTLEPCQLSVGLCIQNIDFINSGEFNVSCPESIAKQGGDACVNFQNNCEISVKNTINIGQPPKPQTVPKVSHPTVPKVSHPTVPPHMTQTAKPSVKKQISGGEIAGIIVGILVLIAAIGIGVYFYNKSKKKKVAPKI